MGNYVSKLLEVAAAQVGYLEKKSNKNLDSMTGNAGSKNYTKFARDLDKLGFFYNGKKNGYAWCDVFVDWCFVEAFGVDEALKLLRQPKRSYGAGCKYSANYYKKKKQFHTKNPQPGDQIFFWNSKKTSVAHTGIVEDVDATYVYTIEGNTSSSSGVVANGGAVARKKYKLSYSRIYGYGRPDFDDEPIEIIVPEPQPQPQLPEIEKPVQIETTNVVHKVRAGDTLWSLAEKYLGSGKRYKEIMELNGLTSATLRVGRMLKIPAKNPGDAKIIIKKGDKVKLNKGAKTYNGKSLASFVYNRVHKVKEINGDRITITYGGIVVAAVRAKDLKIVN